MKPLNLSQKCYYEAYDYFESSSDLAFDLRAYFDVNTWNLLKNYRQGNYDVNDFWEQ